jgi:hypothetical protein
LLQRRERNPSSSKCVARCAPTTLRRRLDSNASRSSSRGG